MTVQIRPLGDKDFFGWHGLFEGYSEFYKRELTDEKALRVWSWIIDKNHGLEGAVAVNDDGDFVGFAHFRKVPQTLSADTGLFLDDLFVVPDARGAGVGSALLGFVKEFAAANHLSQVSLATAADNKTAQKLYTEFGKKSDWVTYEIAVS